VSVVLRILFVRCCAATMYPPHYFCWGSPPPLYRRGGQPEHRKSLCEKGFPTILALFMEAPLPSRGILGKGLKIRVLPQKCGDWILIPPPSCPPQFREIIPVSFYTGPKNMVFKGNQGVAKHNLAKAIGLKL